jgi:hypothetical protein
VQPVFGLLARHTGPLAIMPSADHVSLTNSHSMMLWAMWVVLIAGSTSDAGFSDGEVEALLTSVAATGLIRRLPGATTSSVSNAVQPIFSAL